MPSPVGHLIVGVCVQQGCAGHTAEPAWRLLGFATMAALAPDLDLLLNVLTGRNHHQAESHSVGMALIAGVAAWACARGWGRTQARQIGFVTSLGWLSHVALDYLSVDTSVPIGLMALWPFTDRWYKFSWPIFLPITRSLGWEPMRRNVLAAAWEAVVLLPLLALVWRLRRLRRGSDAGPDSA
jgi:hypothetical protein